MGIVSNIRNFIYAVSHCNSLISENEQLKAGNLELGCKLWEAQNIHCCFL